MDAHKIKIQSVPETFGTAFRVWIDDKEINVSEISVEMCGDAMAEVKMTLNFVDLVEIETDVPPQAVTEPIRRRLRLDRKRPTET